MICLHTSISDFLPVTITISCCIKIQLEWLTFCYGLTRFSTGKTFVKTRCVCARIHVNFCNFFNVQHFHYYLLHYGM